MNTWPGGTRHAMYPEEHECWNASHYPGTRQLCCECEEPTGRCEEDSLFVETESSESVGPLCKTCYDEIWLRHVKRCTMRQYRFYELS